MQAILKRVTLGLLVIGLYAASSVSAQTSTSVKPATAATTGGAAGSIRGHVTDPDGAVIPNATVTATSASGKTVTTKADGFGTFVLSPVPAGVYTLSATVDGFVPGTKTGVTVSAGQIVSSNFHLQIQAAQQNVEVTAENNGTTLDVNPDNNSSAIVLKGKDLDALSDDPDELQNELTALAGPSAGPNGGQIYVDGFTAGQLPPKNAIREIRINQNPFSAQYDQLGYGRIEIFTKPGTDKLHGQFLANINQQDLNTSNPFAPSQPSYDTLQFTGNVSGPINPKSSYFLSGSRRNIQANNLINTEYVNNVPVVVGGVSTFPITDTYAFAYGMPERRTDIAPRYDLLVTPTNTLSVRYQFNENTELNAGVGGALLPSTGSNNLTLEDTLQVSDTQILGAKQNIVNEIHFQYLRDRNSDNPISVLPSITVSGGFSGGGSYYTHDAEDRYEFQDYTSIALAKNFIRIGGRLRINRDSNYSNSNFNGGFTFGPNEYYSGATSATQATTYCATAAAGTCTQTPAIDVYAITLYNLANGFAANDCGTYQTTDGLYGCGGASEYSATTGNPAVLANLKDLGVYAESDWKVKPNFTLSYGLRFETQNYIHDKSDFAPRLAISYGIGAKGRAAPKTVIRAGYGLFYNRFQYTNIETVERQSLGNALEQQTTILNPTFSLTCLTAACTPTGGTVSTTNVPTYYSLQPNLHAATTGQGAVTVERQVGKIGTLTVNYLHSRGLHQYDTEQLGYSAENPTGTYYNNQFSSEGIFKENQVLSNFNLRAGKNVSVTTFYSLSYAKSTAASPSNSYNLLQDYGRATFDVRNRVFIIGNINLPFRITLNPFIVYQSGAPFNITAGSDINLDGNFNDRPEYSTTGNCYTNSNAVAETHVQQYGCFAIPATGTTYTPIPVNLGRGPNLITANLRIGKNFGFGPRLNNGTTGNNGGHGQGGPQGGLGGPGGAGAPGGGGGGGGGGGARGGGGGGGGGGGRGGGGGFGGGGRVADRKYTLGLSVAVQNLFNDVNLGAPSGTMISPTFGTSTQLAGGIFTGGTTDVRTVRAQMTFAF